MAAAHELGHSADSASLRVAAAPEVLWDLVADITQMGRLSPECTGGRWLGRATGPAVGARFVGFNRRGWVRWATTNRVVEAERPQVFAFETKQSGARWRYTFEPDGDGTIVTEAREEWRARPVLARVASRFLLGGIEEHDDEMRAGLQATLERLKALAEG